ncbi:Zn-binding Pro-Ala-Ala-Arg (PAAR) domain-containing protein, incolved in TypeVI secretion [Izhakiella capsodis]|uniref:Zn-binding Pro-Ala-Ala-Arg (PAAR) domain-containing protein, incolved in TypeVI secretion n=1 Tax=Izhakiella capsodis TaxID=1367852 RepID=A0A1I4UXH7_9GAMM|nr:PAAR domain-containing protein [Izhakiella capsodis]SFM93641.1 Zn-binding Pro-Ala-Ala-Arg (PAAR) domain-containing protein, incolved in TypeVI secretion [Izhakiella capsodis]
MSRNLDHAVRVGDFVTCPHCEHTRITSGSSNVFIEGKPAARSGDRCKCGGGVDAGQEKIKINGLHAACVNSNHSGHTAVNGAESVFIGQRSSNRIIRSAGISDGDISDLTARFQNLNLGHEAMDVDLQDYNISHHQAYTTTGTPPLAVENLDLESFDFIPPNPGYNTTASPPLSVDYMDIDSFDDSPRHHGRYASTDNPHHGRYASTDNQPDTNEVSGSLPDKNSSQYVDGSDSKGQTCASCRKQKSTSKVETSTGENKENSLGFIEKKVYGEYVYRADRTPPDEVLAHGFSSSNNFDGVPRMINGDNILIASDTEDGATQYGEDNLFNQSGRNIFYVYRIDAQNVRGSSLMENVERQSSAAIANHWSPNSRPIDIAEGAGEYREVHLDNTQINPNNIVVVNTVERWVPHDDF